MDPAPGATLRTRWAFTAENPDELTIDANAIVTLVEKIDDWVLVEEEGSGRKGLIPLTYAEVVESPPAPATKPVVPPKQFKTAATTQNIISGATQFRLPPFTNNNNNGSTRNFAAPTSELDRSSSSDLLRMEQATSSPAILAREPSSSRYAATPSLVKESSNRPPLPPPSSTINTDAVDPTPNPFELLNQSFPSSAVPMPMPIMHEDDVDGDELAERLRALKARISAIDSDIPEAEEVHLPPKLAPTTPTVPSMYPQLSAPASLLAMQEEARRQQLEEQRKLEEQKRKEMEELREKEQLRLQYESEQRAIRQQREAEEAEIRRREAQREEFERVRRSSAVLSSKSTVDANFMAIANEKLRGAVIYHNNQKYPEAMVEYLAVLDYMQKAFDKNQIADRAQNLARMEEFVEKLSSPPFSLDGSFKGKIQVLAGMQRAGYDLLPRAVQLRTAGWTLEQEKNINGAIRQYKIALEYFVAYKKACDAMGKMPDPTALAATDELLRHAEDLHRLRSGQNVAM